METSEYLETVETLHADARRRGLFFQTCEDERLEGRRLTIGGRSVVSFSSCSYLGLERHPKLIAGVHDAVDRYGTQFSSSRGYLSAPPYEALEEKLSELFGGHALVTSSTTVGHQIALGALCTEKDAIVFDHQAHYSVQMAATLARASGATVELCKHGELEKAEEIVARLAKRHRTVWFACDGVYSMYGDLAPVGLLARLLDVAPNVRLYVDDAHGMSWAGRHGRGSFLSRMEPSPRIVLATSLNKAFSASGGCIVFPTREARERVRMTGGPMVFSGPLQPPMLGAAIASADVHLSGEIEGMQRELRERTDLTNRRLRQAGIPPLVENESPIFFIPLGLPRVAFRVAERLLDEGYYVNVSAYPSVPMKRAGIRLTITRAHEISDIERAIALLAEAVPRSLGEEGLGGEEIDKFFARALTKDAAPPAPSPPTRARRAGAALAATDAVASNPPAARPEPESRRLVSVRPRPAALTLEQHRSIHGIDRALWNELLGAVGSCSFDAMATLEKVFSNQRRPEHDWRFLYLIVRDASNAPVCATFFTESLNKDDMLMRDEVSRAVEARRAGDPYFLTSRVLSMGSGFSEGNHLYLDRRGPWREALTMVLDAASAEYERTSSAVLLLRDLPADDPEVDAFMLDHGLVKIPMFDSHHLDVTWRDDESFLAALGRRKRKAVREIVARSPAYEVDVFGACAEKTLGPGEIAHLFDLYRNVATRKLRLNVFPLPENLIAHLLESPAWELATLRLKPEFGGPEDGAPVAFYAAHRHDAHYAPFFCGLDDRYVLTHGAYRQMIYRMVQRATAVGARVVHMGMDADAEKHRFGSRVVKNCAYLQARDHYSGSVLREIVAEVGVDAARYAVAS